MKGIEKIYVGNVILSKAGQELMSVITYKRKIDGFAEFTGRTIIKDLGGLLEDIKKVMQNDK